MFQKTVSQLAIAVFALSVLVLQQCIAPPSAQAQPPHVARTHALQLPEVELSLIPEAERIKSALEAYDTSPLVDRTPLVLIHGIGGDEVDLFNWENFLTYAQTQPDFLAKYKIYLYSYDSSRSVPTISRDLQRTLTGFISLNDQRKIKILAYSEGGLLTRNALQDPYLDSHTQEVITIATPFHGSPLANPEWMREQIKTDSAFSLVRIGQKIAYKITQSKYPTFREDFRWDNFDGTLPASYISKNKNADVPKSYALASKSNFTTYGSYFGLDVNAETLTQTLELKQPPPKEKPMFGNLFRQNLLFSLIRKNIAKLPLAKPAHPEEPRSETKEVADNSRSSTPDFEPGTLLAIAGPVETHTDLEDPLIQKTTTVESAVETTEEPDGSVSLQGNISQKITVKPVSMMVFNDGISPISSSLWLGRYVKNNNGVTIPVDRLWSTLKSLKGSNKARLFPGIDHRNWMEGITRTGSPLVRDLLNPNEPPKTVFEWIVHDLMT